MVADTGNDQIKVLNPSGQLAGTCIEPDAWTLSAEPFLASQGVSVNSWGEIIVANTGKSRVVKIVQSALPKNFTYLPVVNR